MNRYLLLLTLMGMFLKCGIGSGEKLGSFGNEKSEDETKLNASLRRKASQIDQFFTGLYKQGMFNGSILVAKSGTILYKKSLGVSDHKKEIPLDDSSMFQLASVSKVITATAVLMLHERGKLSIDSSFTYYFPDFPYERITIKELLSHRSGLPNYMYALNDEMCRPDSNMTNEEMYRCFVSKKAPPYLRPGRRFNYCNTNYALLPLLIEKVSGKTYSDFLKEEIFDPVGMVHTSTIYDIEQYGKNITTPYDNRWKKIEMEASDFVLGDKSIYSTPYDLYLFSEALYNNRIIKPETQQQAYTAFSRELRLHNYGYGWRMKNFKDIHKKEVYHNGWWHGYRSSFHRRLKDTLTVVILSNKLNSSTYQAGKVMEILDSSQAGSTPDEED